MEHARHQLEKLKSNEDKKRKTIEEERKNEQLELVSATYPKAAKMLGIKVRRLEAPNREFTEKEARILIIGAYQPRLTPSVGMNTDRIQKFFSDLINDCEETGYVNLLRELATFKRADPENCVSITFGRQFDNTLQPVSGHINQWIGPIHTTVMTEVHVQSARLQVSVLPAGSDDFLDFIDCGRLKNRRPAPPAAETCGKGCTCVSTSSIPTPDIRPKVNVPRTPPPKQSKPLELN